MRSRLLVAGLVAALLAACGATDAGNGEAAATVDGTDIPRSTLEDAIAELHGDVQELSSSEREQVVGTQQRELLALLIQDEILTNIYEDVGASFDDDDLAEVREEVVAGLGGEEQLEETLNQAQLTLTLFEDVFLPQQARLFAIQEELAEGESIETRTTRHILLETEEEADDVIAELDDGADFGELATERSEDPGSGEQGGDLGPAQRGMYVPPFDDAVWDAELDTVVGPVESDFGFHVLEVTDEDVREASELDTQELQQLVGEELTGLVNEAFESAEIEVDPSIGVWDETQRTVVADADQVGEPDGGTPESDPGEPELTPEELEELERELEELQDQG